MQAGVRLLTSGMKVSSKPIHFDKNYIYIGSKKYVNSPGLVELLLKKNPDSPFIKTTVINDYRNILKSTNTHRKHYRSSEHLREYKSQKYI